MNMIMESVKNILGENSIGWRKIKKNQDVLDGLKEWLLQNQKDDVLQKIKELEKCNFEDESNDN